MRFLRHDLSVGGGFFIRLSCAWAARRSAAADHPPKTASFVVGLVILLSVLVFAVCSYAGDEDFGSALIVGVGGAYAAAPGDAGVVWFNPAIMAIARERGEFSVSYRRPFELAALEELHTGVRHRIGRRGTVGAGLARFGESGLYQETKGIVALARRFVRGGAAGVGLRYERTEFGDNALAFAGASLDIGAALRPSENTLVGVAVRNVNLDGVYADPDDDHGALIESSVAWSAPPDITVAGIWSKEDGQDTRFGVGQRLRVGRSTEFLSGLRFDPIRYTLGGRLSHRRGTIDYVYQSHPDLGGTHAIGASWRW